MKYKITILFFLVSLCCSSQQDSTKIKPSINTESKSGGFYINAGIGFSLYQSLINRRIVLLPILFQGENLSINAATPAYNFNFDYNYIPNRLLGVCVSYQKWTGSLGVNSSSLYGFETVEAETRLNIALVYLFSKNMDEETDLYYGGRIGVSYWNVTAPMPATQQNSAYTLNTNYFYPSIQVLVGLRKYITKSFGFNLEVGIGTPYQAGISLFYKFIKK